MVTENAPRLLLVAGPNGSGKTTLTEQGLAHVWFKDCEYINPDLIAQNELGDWNSPPAVLRAAQIAQERREACLQERRSLAFESVFSTPDKLSFLRRGLECGYFIRVFFVCTDTPRINATRIAARVMQGGHEVPLQKIIRRYFTSIANCANAARFVHRLYLYDNSREDQKPRLLLRASEGRISKIYCDTLPIWSEPIAQALRPTAE